MKKIGLAIVALVLIQACKESLPPIDFSVPIKVLIDSTYTIEEDSIPQAAKRGILIEDFTGVRCVNCPDASAAAASIKHDNPDSVVVILGLYPTAPQSLTFPIDNDDQDLRTEVAQLIGANVFKIGGILPGGGVNRTPPKEGDPINIQDYKLWRGLAGTFEGKNSIVNLTLSKEEVNDSTLDVFGTFKFTADAEATPFVSIFLLEDGIIEAQKKPSGTDEDYIHNHVVRKAYTPYNGTPLFEGGVSVIRGKGLKKGWEIVIPSHVNREKASLVFVVNYNDGDKKQVIQCKEVKLKK